MSVRKSAKNDAPPLRKRVLSLPTLLSLAIAAGLIYFLTTRFELDWAKTWDNARSLDPRLYGTAFIVYYLSLSIRGLRWRLLARNAGLGGGPDSRLPSIPRFAQLVLIGWFVNSIGWFRIGDAYRAYALSEDADAEFSASLGIVLGERVLDMTTVLTLTVASVAWYSTTRDSGDAWYVAAASFAMAFALVGVLALMKGYGGWLAKYLPGRFKDRYETFQRGALGSLRQLRAVFVLSLGSWMLEAARLYLVVQALDMSVPLSLVFVAALAQAILSVVPLTPGGVGFVEAGGTTLLSLSLDGSSAASVALVDRTITYLSVLVVGGLAFLLLQASRARAKGRLAAATVEREAAGDPPS